MKKITFTPRYLAVEVDGETDGSRFGQTYEDMAPALREFYDAVANQSLLEYKRDPDNDNIMWLPCGITVRCFDEEDPWEMYTIENYVL